MQVKLQNHLKQIGEILSSTLRLAVIGSTSFWHQDSEVTCNAFGEKLAGLLNLVLLTGGVPGVGETVGRSFFRARRAVSKEPLVYHILPRGYEPWDYGETLFAGTDMQERREVLGRLAKLYVLIEGGPGTMHEVTIAINNGATVIPVGRSGGCAGEIYSRITRPAAVDEVSWKTLGAPEATPEETADAVFKAVSACLAAQ